MFEVERKNSVEKGNNKDAGEGAKSLRSWKEMHWLAFVRSRYTSSQNVTASVTDNVSTDAGKLGDSKVGK